MDLDFLSTLAAGLIIGGAIGWSVGVLLSGRRSRKLEARIDRARQDLDRSRQEASNQIQQIQSSQLDSSKQLSSHRQKSAELERKLADHLAEIARLKAAAEEAQRERDRVMEEVNARQAARVQAEGRVKQAEKLATEATQKLSGAEASLQQALQEKTSLAEANEKAASDMKRLRAELTSARQGASASGLEDSVEAFAETDGSLDKILELLLDREGLDAAVLADTNGIVIASAGDKGLRDGIAATAQLFSSISKQFEGMVPFDTVRTFSISDNNSHTIVGRAFVTAGERVSLATYGLRFPNERLLDGATASLNAALD